MRARVRGERRGRLPAGERATDRAGTTDRREPADGAEHIAALLLAGGCLTFGFGCAAAAALEPKLSSVWTSSSADAVTLLGDPDTDEAWELANRLFAVGIWATLAGLVAVAVLLVRRTHRLLLPLIALVLATGATTLWTLDLSFRLTVMAELGGQATPDWYPHVSAWADDGLLNAASLLGGAACALFGIAVVTSRAVARWTGAFTAACGLLLFGESMATGDAVPALLYLAPLPIGLAALVRAIRRHDTSDSTPAPA